MFRSDIDTARIITGKLYALESKYKAEWEPVTEIIGEQTATIIAITTAVAQVPLNPHYMGGLAHAARHCAFTVFLYYQHPLDFKDIFGVPGHTSLPQVYTDAFKEERK